MNMKKGKKMMKKVVFLICCALLVMTVSIPMALSDAEAVGHYDIPGTYLGGCDVCHDFINGEYAGTGNLRWVKSEIDWPVGGPVEYTGVTYTKLEDLPLPADGTLADGNNSDIDGPCEVCHTSTTYHIGGAGDPLNPRHYAGENCTRCHPHFADNQVNYFEPVFKGPQSHTTHLSDLKGPIFNNEPGDPCLQCHDAGSFSLFIDGQPKATTTVCDPCHSPDGAFDGSADAKAKWENAVYEANGTDLKTGNANWCASCHDGGTSAVYGVAAPDVAGDDSSWGYNVTGHGAEAVVCEDCHDLAVAHIDKDARTYSATSSPNNYQSGYRLNEGMAVPRNGENHPIAFRLCTGCHLYTDVTGPESKFRDDGSGQQYHDTHLNLFPAFIAADSDFSSPPTCIGGDGICVDSAMTCVNCHNVHGARNPAMIRDGELMSTPGTDDKEPGFEFYWLEGDGATQTTVLGDSRYGSLVCGTVPILTNNHSCFGCHASGRLTWFRNPTGQQGITLDAVWTEDTSDLVKTVFDINPPQAFRVKARFTVAGTSGPYFVQIANSAVGNSPSMPGPDWSFPLAKQGNAGNGTFEVQWQGTIPATAGDGSPAKVRIRIYVFDTQGGTLLDQDEMLWDFSTADLP
jgi:hypothetical protein